MKILLFSDLHLQKGLLYSKIINGVDNRLQDGLNILKQISFLVKKENINQVVFLGDWCEKKDRIDNEIIYYLKYWLKKILKEASIISLIGNHDYEDQEYTLLDNLDLDIVQVKDPKLIKLANNKKGYFIPFCRNDEDFIKVWNWSHENYTFDYLFFHNALPDFNFNNNNFNSNKLIIKKNILYFGGHIHSSIEKNNIIYVGSPLQTDFKHCKDDHFIYYLEDTRYYKLILTYPKFKEFNYYNIDYDQVNNCYIKITGKVNKDFNKNEVKQKLDDAGALGTSFNINYEITKREIVGDYSKESIIEKYVNTFKTDLDKKKLIKIGKEI